MNNNIFDSVYELIQAEMSTIAQYRVTGARSLFRAIAQTRIDLLHLLKEAEGLRDIPLLLDIERAFMELDLDHLAYDPEDIKSLRAGIRQLGAAAIMLDRVVNPNEYQYVVFYYTLSQDLLNMSDLPKDAAQKFFGSHRARLINWRKNQNVQERTDLLNARISYIDWARREYKEMQRLAMATGGTQGRTPAEVREPFKQYRARQDYKLAA